MRNINRKKFKDHFYNNMTEHGSRVVKPDYSILENYKRVAEAIDAVENKPTYILDLYTSDFFYVSHRYLYLLGHTTGKIDFNFFFNALHPDDYSITTDAPNKYLSFIEPLPVGEKYNYKLVSDFRLKMPTGEYVRVLEQMILLQTDSAGNPWLIFAICDLSPSQNIHIKSAGKIINIVNGETVLEIGNTANLNPSSVLTAREKEVLLLISKGLASKQIADKLGISINTVNNHRRNILHKTGCANTFETIKYIAISGI